MTVFRNNFCVVLCSFAIRFLPERGCPIGSSSEGDSLVQREDIPGEIALMNHVKELHYAPHGQVTVMNIRKVVMQEHERDETCGSAVDYRPERMRTCACSEGAAGGASEEGRMTLGKRQGGTRK